MALSRALERVPAAAAAAGRLGAGDALRDELEAEGARGGTPAADAAGTAAAAAGPWTEADTTDTEDAGTDEAEEAAESRRSPASLPLAALLLSALDSLTPGTTAALFSSAFFLSAAWSCSLLMCSASFKSCSN